MKKSIKNATKFKVTYSDLNGEEITIKSKEFKSIKSMEQWIVRNDCLALFIHKRYALLDDWEVFTTIGKNTLLLSELKRIVKQMEDMGCEQKYVFEDNKHSKAKK
ncbi:MAG: hypothetical protein FWC39_10660 [Bacteroidetes bacterium]|nr:hypothetical protein [Bacteroidota bacterium]